MNISAKTGLSISQLDWQWPDSLDAIAAAPGNHKLLFENEHVRVLDTRIESGDRTPVHTHCWPASMYILSWSEFIRYSDTGEVMLDSRTVEALKEPPAVLWSAPLPPHSLENIGETPLHVISVEVKGAAS